MNRYFALIVILSMLLCSQAIACEGCYDECNKWMVNWDSMSETNRNIAIAVWFKVCSKYKNENDLKMEYYDEYQDNVRQYDKGEYAKRFNIYKSYVPANFSVRKNVIKCPLLKTDNELWFPMYFFVGDKKKYLFDISFENPENLQKIQMEFYVIKQESIGGQLQSGTGYDLGFLPRKVYVREVLYNENGFQMNTADIKHEVLNYFNEHHIKDYTTKPYTVVMKLVPIFQGADPRLTKSIIYIKINDF